jgi:glutamate decarboxylase
LHRSADRVRPTRNVDANPFVGEANPAYGQRVRPPRDRMADDPVPPEVAYQVIHDELLLDGSSD